MGTSHGWATSKGQNSGFNSFVDQSNWIDSVIGSKDQQNEAISYICHLPAILCFPIGCSSEAMDRK